MASQRFPRLQTLCEALPKTKLDEQFVSLSLLQQLLVFVATFIVPLTMTPLLFESAVPVIGAGLAFGTWAAFTELIARYNQR